MKLTISRFFADRHFVRQAGDLSLTSRQLVSDFAVVANWLKIIGAA